jgi:hypothetical protein
MIDVTVLLDKSGSMHSIKESTIKGYNDFLKTQKELKTEGYITLVQFSSEEYKKGKRESLIDSSPLTHEGYRPDGMTPLYDCLGKTIKETGDKLRDMKNKPDKVLFIIITDGLENYSKEYKREDVAKMIEHQKSKYSWDFLYLGANQDSFTEAGNIGINMTGTMNFASSHCMYKNVGTMVARYSTTGDASFTQEERLLQSNADSTFVK